MLRYGGRVSEQSVREVLAAHGSLVSEADVAAVLRDSMEAVGAAPGVRAGTAHDVTALLDHSGLDERARAGVEQTLRSPGAVGRLRSRVAAQAASWSVRSWPAADTCSRLGLSRSGLSRRVSERRIYALPSGHSHLFPAWQFVEDDERGWETLPGLAPALSGAGEAHPAAVAAAMTTPQDETGGMTPREWLITGGDPTPVASLLAGLSQW